MTDAAGAADDALTLLSRTPERVAFQDEHEALTYGEAHALGWRLARALARLGVRPGHVIALAVPLRARAFPLCYAVNALGAGHLLLPVWLPAPAGQLATVLATRPDAVVVDPDAAPPGSRAAELCERLSRQGGATLLSLGPHPGAPDLLAAAGREPAAPFPRAARPADPRALWLTGGTTGTLKWATFPFGTRRPPLFRPYPEPGAPVRPLVAYRLGPVPHGLAACALAASGTVVTRGAVDPAALLATLEAERITEVSLFPRGWRRVLAAASRTRSYDMPYLRRISFLGDCASPALLRAAIRRFGPVVHVRYGQNEAGLLAELRPEDYASRPDRLRTCGRPAPGIALTVLDHDGREAGAGGRGEIWVRGPGVMSGYWRRPDLTARVMRAGWLRTGDAGGLDDDGFLTVLGRLTDTFRSDGRLMGPADVEARLDDHPAVAESALFTLRKGRTADAVPHVAVVADPRTVTGRELSHWLHEGTGITCPAAHVHFVPEIPVAASGKTDRRALAAKHGLRGAP
ncbi:class I adenylate-forming enzyme family protein [Streptomyces sp. UNOC14_S4]|uniref:class I adenylate-forming enzyme family protein n=1 Tax=Streptomyces sp. UNOC14_S4 TaxID=2872340 RepID=UPI001E5A9A76|nr:AMP-binding protein [Streptomyces sp. UNOC14_S4]MCC3771518.1 AMP-binding protein [Streptomyces sp. UNOC14_S4]